MRQSRPDLLSQAAQFNGLGDVVYEHANTSPRAGMFSRQTSEGSWEEISASGFLGEVTAAAKGMIAAGIGAGDRVVLVCGTRYEWVLLAFAAWVVRAIVVPVHPRCSQQRLRHVMRDCRPAAVVLEDGRHASTVSGIGHELTDLARIWRLDETGMEAITRPGTYIDPTAVRFRREEASREDPALITYPVSTAESSRGVVLTQGNLLAVGERLAERMRPGVEHQDGRECTLLHTPLADGFAQTTLVACVLSQVRVGLLEEGNSLLNELRVFRPTVLVTLPRVLERIHAQERARMRESGWDNLNSFEAATDVAIEFDKAERKGAWRRVSRAMYDWIFSRIREALGGRVRFVVCAGGALPLWVDRFFNGAGIPVFHAFGTVETAHAVAANAPEKRRSGTAGQPLRDVEVQVSEVGELYVRGPGVFSGYWNDVEASRAAFRDGWLASGVTGTVDPDGYVSVGERLFPDTAGPEAAGDSNSAEKDRDAATKTQPPEGSPADSAGDYVHELEQRLRTHPLVSQAMVISEGRPFTTALVTLAGDQLEYWRLVNGRPLAMSPQEIAADPDMVTEIQGVVQEANGAVPAVAQVRAFHILAEEFTVQSGLVLNSGELRRTAVLWAFSEEIDGLYRQAQHQHE